MDGMFEEQVRQRAYEIWVDLGRSDGQAHDHWIAAERDLMARPAKAATAPGAAAKAKTTLTKSAKAAAPKAPAAKQSKARKTSVAAASASA